MHRKKSRKSRTFAGVILRRSRRILRHERPKRFFVTAFLRMTEQNEKDPGAVPGSFYVRKSYGLTSSEKRASFTSSGASLVTVTFVCVRLQLQLPDMVVIVAS